MKRHLECLSIKAKSPPRTNLRNKRAFCSITVHARPCPGEPFWFPPAPREAVEGLLHETKEQSTRKIRELLKIPFPGNFGLINANWRTTSARTKIRQGNPLPVLKDIGTQSRKRILTLICRGCYEQFRNKMRITVFGAPRDYVGLTVAGFPAGVALDQT